MCRSIFGSGRCWSALMILALVLAWGAAPAFAQPNPQLNGVDCVTIKAGAQSDTADPRWEDNNADFAVNCAGLNPLGWGYDYAHAWVYLDTATNSLYLCIDTFGFPGDADGDGGYASGDPTFCGGWQNTCGPVAEDPNFVFGGPEEINLRLDRNCDGFNDLVFRLSSDQLRIDSDSFTPANNGTLIGGRGDAWEIAPDQAQGSTLFGDPLCDDPRSREGAVIFCIPNVSSYFDPGLGLSELAFDWRVSGGHADDQFSEDAVSGILNEGDPSIDILKTADKTELCTTGDVVTFTLRVENTGNVSLDDVTVTDVLPAGLTYTAAGACDFGAQNVAGQTITWDLGTLAAGEVRSCSFTATSAGCVGTIRNNADVVGTVTAPCVLRGGQPFDLTDADFVDLACFEACVDVRPADDIAACAGTDACITFVVENCATQEETINFQGMFNGVNVAANPAQAVVPAGQTVNVEVCGTLPVDCANVPVKLTATTSLGVGCDAEDMETANILCDVPNVDIEKTANPTTTNGTSTITLVITNPAGGPSIDPVRVTDLLPPGLSYLGNFNSDCGATVSSVAPGPNAGETLITLDDFGPLAAGASCTITFEVECLEFDATHTNLAEVDAWCDGVDPNVVPPVEDSDTADIFCEGGGEACPHTIGFWRQQYRQAPNGSTKICLAGMYDLNTCVVATTGLNEWLLNDGSFVSSAVVAGLGDAALFDALEEQIQGPRPMTHRDMTELQYLGLLLNVCAGSLPMSTPLDNAGGFTGTVGEAITAIEDALNNGGDITYWGGVADAINNRVGVLGADCEIDPFRNQPACVNGVPAPGTGGLELQAYPNPVANGTTTISYALPEAGRNVAVSIYSVTGRLVRSFAGAPNSSGMNTVEWNLRDSGGHQVSNGIYFYRVSDGLTERTQRLLVVRN